MSTFVDHQIRLYARTLGMIEPFNPEQVNPASYDVRLGPEILTEGLAVGPEEMRKRWRRVNINDGYILEPNEFVLGVTMEYIRVPNDTEAVFQLKSSRGREGYNHALAGYIDPGFCGRVTLELHNLNQRHNLILKTGMLIGQLRFSKLDALPMRSYKTTGHYHGDDTVQESKVSPFTAN
jgi:dCTP deaminase